MRWMPFYKLLSTFLRSIIFMFVMILIEPMYGSINLLSFVSIVTVLGIIFGFGSQDSLLGASTIFFNIYKISSILIFIILLIGSILIFFESFLVNSILSALYFGSIFWSLGEIRIYSMFYYELLLSSYMVFLWVLYLLLLPYETESFNVLTSLFFILSILVFILTLIFRNKCNDQRSKVDGSFSKIAVSKLTWEVSYSALTRSPFLFWMSFAALPSIFSYLYYFCELLSAIISHFQSKFLISKQKRYQTLLYFKLMIFLTTGYVLGLSIVFLIFLFQDKLILILTEYKTIYSLFLPIFTITKIDLVLCIICSLVILILQWIAYARYAFKLHANIKLVFIFFIIFLINTGLIYFYVGPLGKEALIISSLLLTIILSFGLCFILISVLKKQSIDKSANVL